MTAFDKESGRRRRLPLDLRQNTFHFFLLDIPSCFHPHTNIPVPASPTLAVFEPGEAQRRRQQLLRHSNTTSDSQLTD